MKPGDKIRQSVPDDKGFPMVGIEAVVLEILEDGTRVEFLHPTENKVVQQIWPTFWKIEVIEESS